MTIRTLPTGVAGALRPDVGDAPPGPSGRTWTDSTLSGSFFSEFIRDSPWRVADVTRAGTRVALGLIAIVVAWFGASGVGNWRHQLIWIGVGTAGAVVVAAGAGLWLLSGLGLVSLERRNLKRRLSQTGYIARSTTQDAPILMWTPGMSRYHRPNCQMVQRWEVEPLSRARCLELQLKPCGICAP